MPDFVTPATDAADRMPPARQGHSWRRGIPAARRDGSGRLAGSWIAVDGAVERDATPNCSPPATEMLTPPWVPAVRVPFHGRAGQHDEIRDLSPPLERELDNPFLFDNCADLLRTSTIGAAASTETALELPTANTALIVGDAPTCRTMPVCT